MRINKSKFMLIMGALGAVLSGCAPMNSSFDCNKVGGLGAGCVSLDQVNDMANKGQFNQNTLPMQNGAGSSQSAVVANPGGTSPYQLTTPFPGAPVRVGETSERVWIAAWVDTEGRYHEPSYIYFVSTPGYWVGSPAAGIASNTN